MAKNDDEKVNGPKIAAAILNKMKSANKDRIMRDISAVEPALAAKIKADLFDFNQIVELTPASIQVLIKAVDHKDWVITLKQSTPAVKDAVFACVSARMKKMLEDDISAATKVSAEQFEAAKRRILDTLEKLRQEGKLKTMSKHDQWV